MKPIDKLSWKLTRMMPLELANKLELGSEVEITIKGEAIQEIVSDNQEGTVNVCYVIKPIITELKNGQN